MIKLDLAVAVAMYIGFFAIGLLFIWVFLEKGRFKKYSSDDKYIWHCNICTHVYVDSRHEHISTCPKCGTYIKKELNK